jgi:hypothetical protein
MHQYNVGAPFERIAIDIAGSFPESKSGEPIPPDCHRLLHQVAGGFRHPQSKGMGSVGCSSDQLLLPLRSPESCTVTRAGTQNLG